VTVKSPLYYTDTSVFLGVFGIWLDVSTVSTAVLPTGIPLPFLHCEGICKRGICSPLDAHCICLPSWTGQDCSIPIDGYVSLYRLLESGVDGIRYISPDLGRAFDLYTRSDFVLGVIPLYLVPPSIRLVIPPLLLNMGDWIGPLELLLFANITVYLFWTLSSFQSSTFDFMTQHFSMNWVGVRNGMAAWLALTTGRVYTIATSSFSHSSLVHLSHNMLTLFQYAPGVVGVLGTEGFIRLYLFSMGRTYPRLTHSRWAVLAIH
jgi:hypothetical protein